jgi:hypothetical protein
MTYHTIHGRFINRRPCFKIAVVGFSRELTCELDTSGAYHLLLPWLIAVQAGFRPTLSNSRVPLINGFPLLARRGTLQVEWPGGVIDVPTRVYGRSHTSSPMWLPTVPMPARPRPPIDGYIGGDFFQQNEKVVLEYVNGFPSVHIEVPIS